MAIVSEATYDSARGRCIIYRRSGGTWTNEQTILGNETSCEMGWGGNAIDMNNNGNIIAIGSPAWGRETGTDYGRLETYKYNNSTNNWEISTFVNGGNSERFGCSVEMNSSGTRVIVGCRQGTEDVYFYSYDSIANALNLLHTFSNSNSYTQFGWSLSMNDDCSRIVLGHNTGFTVFEYDIGLDTWIEKENITNNSLSYNLKLNHDGDVMVVANNSNVKIFASRQMSFEFDGYNKLTIENVPDDITGITLYHKPTGSEVETSVDIGTASTVNINETGTYRAETKAVSSYTFTEN
jgi:hypothetical protein